MFLDTGAHDVDAAAAADDLAMLANLLDGRTDFHDIESVAGLFVAVRDSTAVEIIRRQFHADLVTGQNLDKMHAHFARNVTENFVPVFQYHTECSVGQAFLNHTVNLNGLFFRNAKPLIYKTVNTSAAPSVTTSVCSKCAAGLRSRVSTSQSPIISTSGPPIAIIGSIANTMFFLSTGPRPGVP